MKFNHLKRLIIPSEKMVKIKYAAVRNAIKKKELTKTNPKNA